MHSSNESSHRIKEPLGSSSLEDWPSFLENSPQEEMPLLSHVSRLELIALSLREVPGLVALSILWILFVIGLVFVSIQLTSWAIPQRASSANLTAVSLLENDSAGWTGRKPFSCLSPQCDDWRNTLEEGRSSLRYEIQDEEEVTYVA